MPKFNIEDYKAYKLEKKLSLPYIPKYELIETKDRAEEVRDILLQQTTLGLDIETTGLDPHTCEILLCQIATPNFCYILNCSKVSLVVWKPILENKNIVKVSHNAKFEYKFLKRHVDSFTTPMFCTMLAERILTSGTGQKADLQYVVNKYLGIHLDKDIRKNFVNRPRDIFTEEELAYAANDALILHPVCDIQIDMLQRDELINTALLEFNTMPAVAEIELKGCLLDEEKWRSLIEKAREKRSVIEKHLQELLKPACPQLDIWGNSTINLGSQQQILKALQKLGLDIESTGEKILAMSRTKETEALLEWRRWNTVVVRYGEKFLAKINKNTGRIHPEFNQLGTDTGRFSSEDPNGQQVPRYDPNDPDSLNFRSCFISAPKKVIGAFDFSQEELRIAAELSGDSAMMSAFVNKLDIHARAASFIFGIPLDKVTKEQRNTAKTTVFALLYGAGAYRIAGELKVSEQRAEEIINNFFKAYPGVKDYLRLTGNAAIKDGFSKTVAGRKRYYEIPSVDDLNYDKKIAAAQRESKNCRIQGSGADVMKQALCNFFYACKEKGYDDANIILIVHDEIVCEAREDQADGVFALLKKSMIEGFQYFFKRVPIEVDGKVNTYWEH